jgi:tRNA(Ile)-lysidine synthetase-like protein
LQLQRLDVAADYPTIEWLRAKPNCPISISPLISVYRDDGGSVWTLTPSSLAFKPGEQSVLLNGIMGEVSFNAVRCRWRVVPSCSLARPRSNSCESFDADVVGPSITLRHWRPGDRFQPIGMTKPVKLQDWFTNQKIPLARRRELVLAATAKGEVFWVEGLRISERFKLTKMTRRRLIWRWQRV